MLVCIITLDSWLLQYGSNKTKFLAVKTLLGQAYVVIKVWRDMHVHCTLLSTHIHTSYALSQPVGCNDPSSGGWHLPSHVWMVD